MIQVEANACAKPVIAIDAMAFLDTMVHGETAFLAKVAEERKITEAVFGEGHGIDNSQSHRVSKPANSGVPSQRARHRQIPPDTHAATAICGGAWAKRAENAWSSCSTIARWPGAS